MPPRVPTEADFTPLRSSLTFTLTWPKPAELTTSFLIILHGLGDSETPLTAFAQALNLPGVLCITVRGVSPLPSALLGFDAPAPGGAHFHWGDDLTLDPGTGDLDADPGFDRARRAVMEQLVQGTLVEKCGWGLGDVMLFGFGQGGSLALGLASALRMEKQVEDVTDGAVADKKEKDHAPLKGVVSIGGPLPGSMVPSVSLRAKSKTKVLAVQIEDEDVDTVRKEFDSVEVVRWKRREVAMPRDREEMFPIMKFFAERLKEGAW